MRIDSPIISTGIKLTNLLILNLYLIIGCLPVITIGTSTIAAFSVTLKMTEDREGASMTVQFWKAYVKNLKHGIPLSLILLAGCGSILLDVRMIEARAGDAMGLLTAGIILILLLLLHFIYVFPLEARYQNGLLAGLAVKLRLGDDAGMISIGNIMLLIPGVALTNSLRDMFSGNTISGLMRFIESILLALTIAFGFALAAGLL